MAASGSFGSSYWTGHREQSIGEKDIVNSSSNAHSPASLRTVDYYAKFSQHAFENTAQNFYMPVVIKHGGEASGTATPARELKCAASFTIRRDVFDLVGPHLVHSCLGSTHRSLGHCSPAQ